MNSEIRFELFDHPPRRFAEVDGVTTLGDPDREVVQEHGVLEPLDVRIDMWLSVPVRSSLQFGDPAFEIGPFSLGPAETIALHNALVDHINNFHMAKFVAPGGAS
ncbi:hypothetical protein [Mycolicibacterium fortuitum]|uniref:hypothetical protein n=1 Tax=Mycolicibacterium fortuitum TaxID=1766 RepID=UPI00241E8EE8|nr:hypothetical protein [Mycolicibacterium fortuitum]MDG5773903.1 hypothetical protein [Mycolicibacterium fortuitum]MDG5779712.1 hypothetical protein [Mycolicibacterium fortuitum]